MPLDLLITGGEVVTPTGTTRLDLGIVGGQIVELEPELSTPTRERLDAKGKQLFPATLDSHVHFNDPGRASWEGIATGSAALAAGGGALFFDMPLNSSPPTLDRASFELKLASAQANSVTDFALWGGLTPRNLDRLGELAECGVIGFKAFMSNSGIDDFLACDDQSLYEGMAAAAKLNLPVAVHAESEAITSALTARMLAHGKTTACDYLDSRPVIAELEAIQRVLLFAKLTGCRVHVVHISTRHGIELLRRYAREFEVDATCETCPHYLLLNEDDVTQQGAVAKCAPPLRSKHESADLLEALNEGLVDTVGSDHSPAPPDMKTSTNFFEVWGGISGVQVTLRSLLTLGVPAPRIAAVLAANVAARFRLRNKGLLEIGNDADIAIVDSGSMSSLTREELLDRHKLSPYLGREFRGRIERTLLRGRTIFADNKLIEPRAGQLVKPVA
jgi:allantoinase